MRELIIKRLLFITAVSVVLSIGIIFLVYIFGAQGSMREQTDILAWQVETILSADDEFSHTGALAEKSDLSFVLSLLSTADGSDLYAIDRKTGEILGTTVEDIGVKNIHELGITVAKIRKNPSGFHARVDGEYAYCVFTDLEHTGIFVGKVCSNDILYRERNLNASILVVTFLAAALAIVWTVWWYIRKLIVLAIYEINTKLARITDGHLDEVINVDTTPEFVDLSGHINEMVASLSSMTDKLSSVLDVIQLQIGVYEYKKGRVYATKKVPQILGLSEAEAEKLFKNIELFELYIKEIKAYTVPGQIDVYQTGKSEIHYIKMESFRYENSTFGVLIDVTQEVMDFKAMEKERDVDLLTGLLNRRALVRQTKRIISDSAKAKAAMLIMLDADGLKGINDKYGHEAGDKYLKEIASLLKAIRPEKSIISRQGGDEFVMFFYGCEDIDELIHIIRQLEIKREVTTMKIEEEIFPVAFSFGYSFYPEEGMDYQALMAKADARMYKEKSERKGKKYMKKDQPAIDVIDVKQPMIEVVSEQVEETAPEKKKTTKKATKKAAKEEKEE